MALQQVRQFPDPVLKQRSREVEAFDDDLAALAARMIDLMNDAHGAGLAAPQIGLLRRMFVYEVSEDEGPVVVVNPEIVEASDELVIDGEGCLSLSLLIDERHDVPVERHAGVKLRSFDVEGNEVVRDSRDTPRASIQHELDHLDGDADPRSHDARGPRRRPASPAPRAHVSDGLGFAATSAYGAECLRRVVAAGAEIAVVLTQPDRPAGRSRRPTPPPAAGVARRARHPAACSPSGPPTRCPTCGRPASPRWASARTASCCRRRCSTRSRGSTCTRPRCRAGAVRRRWSGRSWPATRRRRPP